MDFESAVQGSIMLRGTGCVCDWVHVGNGEYVVKVQDPDHGELVIVQTVDLRIGIDEALRQLLDVYDGSFVHSATPAAAASRLSEIIRKVQAVKSDPQIQSSRFRSDSSGESEGEGE